MLARGLERRGHTVAIIDQTADAFRPYADAVVRRLGDRVRHWFTLNEMPCSS